MAETAQSSVLAKLEKQARPRIEAERFKAFVERQPEVRGPVELEPFEYIEDGGGSNGIAFVSAQLDRNGEGRRRHEFVLRYAPGEQLLKQKRFDEEFETLRCVTEHGIPAPKPYWVSQASDEIGFPFLVMERIRARAPSNRLMFTVGLLGEASANDRRAMVLDAAGFHGRLRKAALGPAQVPHLVGRGVGATPVECELSWWMKEVNLVARPNDHRLKYLESLVGWMIDHQPATRPATLVHGDAQIANLVFRDNRFAAAIDWELSYLGHNEADLALVTMLTKSHIPPGEVVEGVPSEEELIARYEEEAGARVEHWEFFQLLNLVKVSAIMVMTGRHADEDMAEALWRINAEDREIAWGRARAAGRR